MNTITRSIIDYLDVNRKREQIFVLLLFIMSIHFSFSQVTIYSENFNSESDTYPLHSPSTGSSSWTAVYISGSTGGSSDSRWAIYQPAGTGSKLLEMYVGGTDKIYRLDKACNTVAYDNNIVNASCYNTLTLSFDWAAGGESGNNDDHLIPCYSLDNGSTWFDLGSPLHNSASYPNLISISNMDISVLDGQIFNIGFRWVNDVNNGTNNGPLIDNIVIRGVLPACSGTPDAGTAEINYSTGCQGEDIGIDLTSNISSSVCTSGLTYQWQSSPNGSTSWTNLSGQTNPASASDVTTATKYYRLSATCSNSGINSYSNVLSYTAVACTDYLIDAHSSVTTCLGMFYDTGGDGTGGGNNYGNSETETITFCSGSSDHIMVDFTMFETENDGDFGVDENRIDILTVYDGNNTSAPKMFELSGGNDPDEGPVPLIISSGSCLTFQFTSNGSTNDKGWEAMVSCTSEPNNVASNFCETAPFICNLNGYSGTTSNFYNPESVGGQIGSFPSTFDGTLDNNSFIIFQPTSSTVSLELSVSNCTGGITSTSGFYEAIQFAVYEEGAGGNCDIGADVSDYYDVYDGVTPGTYTKNLTGLNIGDTYYIVVDGLWGTVCDYTIDVNSGITLPTIDVNQAIICSGNNVTITASGGSSYLWSTGETTPSITVSAQDTYTVEVSSGNPSCPDNTLLSSNIIVDACLPVTLTQFSGRCLETFERILEWSTASENNSDYFAIEKSTDGIIWNEIGQVTSSHYSNTPKNYSFYDQSREFSTSYYRLKQYDFDGAYDTYNTISIGCDNPSDQFVIYPNPANSFIYIELPESYSAKNTIISFFNVQGKLVQKNSFEGSSSNGSIDVSNLASGCYMLRVEDNLGNFETVKFTKN